MLTFMMEWTDKPWKAPAKSLVLYCPKEQWRFATFSDFGVVDGFLADVSPETAPEEAQRLLVARVQADTELTYAATWKSDKPRWWSAELTVVPS
jgi:hypothetical protein